MAHTALASLLAAVLLLTSCAPGAGGSSNPGTPPAGASGAAMEESSSMNGSSPPREEPVPAALPDPGPQLTQEDIDQALARVMEKYSAVAVAVATVESGQLSQFGAWGWAVKGQREMTADTKVRVASISKVVLGICAMAMVDDGLLDLDAPMSGYWGAGVRNPYSKTQPSACSLMTHTSSLRGLEMGNGLSKLRGRLSASSAWRSMEPGDGGYWAYSNFGASILGVTLELAAGRPLDQYLQERFLQPLEARASLHAGFLEAGEVACLYNSSGGVERSPEAQTRQSVPSQIGGGATYFPGGFTVSAVDMAKLMAILAGDGSFEGARYLSPETVAAMEQPRFTVTPESGAPFEQCLILRRQEDLLGQDVLCYHTGSAYGVFSLFTYNPDTGDGVVVITTGAPRRTDEYGLYALCSALSEELYARMEGDLV